MNIPACYIVLLSFSVVLVSNTIVRNHLLYFAGSITGLLLGMWFSYHEIKKNKKCPRFFGIPLCFVSLNAFTLIILLKLFL